jgi:hypothetical protein
MAINSAIAGFYKMSLFGNYKWFADTISISEDVA